MRRLLIIACSATKRQAEGRVAAVDLYDGPSYRILRPRMTHGLVVLVISAEHGAIDGGHYITTYDRMMTPERGDYLKRTGKLGRLTMMLSLPWESIHVHGGKHYRAVLPMAKLEQLGASVSSGGIGQQLGQLKAWLERTAN